MVILLVDDQTSILEGLCSGIDFEKLGFTTVKCACSSAQALEIFRQTQVDVLVSDLEMPGENGLVLNAKVREQYPDTLRILLTSHADFFYAKKSIQLGCFDYLVQPAPFDEIEVCLRRAVQQVLLNRQRRQLQLYGQLYKKNETEVLDHAVRNLFSRYEQDVQASIDLLNQLRYPLHRDSCVQLLFLDVPDYRLGRSPQISERDIQSALQSVLEKAAVDSPFSFLRTQTPRRLFVILLMSSTGDGPACSADQAQALYHALCEALPQRFGFYVGKAIALADCREESHRIQTCIENNINNEPGLYFTDREHPREDGSRGTLSDCVPRWKSLLAQGHRTMLLTEIQRYLERSGSSHSDSFRNLCDLHQQLTQIFFSFFYENKIEIRDLFTPEYSYQDYMDSFKNTELLWQGIHFMMDAIDRSQRKQGPQSEIEKAKCYIIENISRPILVTDVAEHVNLSTEYLTRLFKKETGRSIKAFITEAKVSAAKDLLANPNIPVSIVALELGYDNFSHFTQMFKKYEQLTPSEYRKKLLSPHED